jgi:hypothetical protein
MKRKGKGFTAEPPTLEDVLNTLSKEERKELLKTLPEEQRKKINEVLSKEKLMQTQPKAGGLVPEKPVVIEVEKNSAYNPEDDPASELAEIEKAILTAELPRPRDLIDRIFRIYPEDNSIERLQRAKKKMELLAEIRSQACTQILQKRRLGLEVSRLDIERFKNEIMLHPKVQQLVFELQLERMQSEHLRMQHQHAGKKLEIFQLEKEMEFEKLRWERRMDVLRKGNTEELQEILQQEYEILQWEKKLKEIKSPKKEEKEQEKEDELGIGPDIREAISHMVEDVYDLTQEKEKRIKKTRSGLINRI